MTDYFYDDDFTVQFDANLKDLPPFEVVLRPQPAAPAPTQHRISWAEVAAGKKVKKAASEQTPSLPSSTSLYSIKNVQCSKDPKPAQSTWSISNRLKEDIYSRQEALPDLSFLQLAHVPVSRRSKKYSSSNDLAAKCDRKKGGRKTNVVQTLNAESQAPKSNATISHGSCYETRTTQVSTQENAVQVASLPSQRKVHCMSQSLIMASHESQHRSPNLHTLKSCLRPNKEQQEENLASSMPEAMTSEMPFSDTCRNEACKSSPTTLDCQVKKSVSFNECIQLLVAEDDDLDAENVDGGHVALTPRTHLSLGDPVVGGGTSDDLLAVFPLGSPLEDTPPSKQPLLVEDVRRAVTRVQDTYHRLSSRTFTSSRLAHFHSLTDLRSPQLKVVTCPVPGSHPELALEARHLATELKRLLEDGLAPTKGKPMKPAAQKALQDKLLWTVVEESCKPDCTHRAVVESLREARLSTRGFPALPEVHKFEVFVVACLNHKSLGLWLGHLLLNTSLLQRHFHPASLLRSLGAEAQRTRASLVPPPKPLSLVESLSALVHIPFSLTWSSSASPKPSQPTHHSSSKSFSPTSQLPILQPQQHNRVQKRETKVASGKADRLSTPSAPVSRIPTANLGVPSVRRNNRPSSVKG